MTICPQCRREIKTRRNKFGDTIYAPHKMATTGDFVRPDHEIHDDYKPGHSVNALALWQIDCPMSLQPLEEKE